MVPCSADHPSAVYQPQNLMVFYCSLDGEHFTTCHAEHVEEAPWDGKTEIKRPWLAPEEGKTSCPK